MGEPLIIAAPGEPIPTGTRSSVLASTLDLLPTFLNWTGIPFQPYSLNGATVQLTGKNLLPYLGTGRKTDAGFTHPVFHRPGSGAATARQHNAAPAPIPANATRIHASFQLHEISEYYPMRV